jgi:hypothetical protein
MSLFYHTFWKGINYQPGIKLMNYYHISDMRHVLWFNPNNIDIYVKTSAAGNNKGRKPYVHCLA